MQKTKLGGRFWLALTVFSLVGQVAWVVENMYFNVFIYKMFHATAAQISLMVAASAVVATLTTILIGALSDRVGRRKIFICVGYLLWGDFHSQLCPHPGGCHQPHGLGGRGGHHRLRQSHHPHGLCYDLLRLHRQRRLL